MQSTLLKVEVQDEVKTFATVWVVTEFSITVCVAFVSETEFSTIVSVAPLVVVTVLASGDEDFVCS